MPNFGKNRFRMKIKGAILLATTLSTQAQIFIDTFDDGNFSVTTTPASVASSGSSMVGGSRLFAANTSGVTASVSGGAYTVTTPGINTIFKYGTIGGFSDLALNMGANQSPFINVKSLTAPFNFALNLFSADGTDSGDFVVSRTGQTIGSFVSHNGDWSHITGFSVVIPASSNVGTFSIESIGLTSELPAVPEPSTYGLVFGVGLIGFASVRQWTTHKTSGSAPVL